MNHLEKALKHIDQRPKKAKYHIQQALDRESEHEVVNGHLLSDPGHGLGLQCVVSGCNVFEGAKDEDTFYELAESVKCPATYIDVEHSLDSGEGL